MSTSHEVFLEVGQKRIFAVVPRWPGWCRSARDEEGALQALLDYVPRYAQVLARTDLDFAPPESPSDFHVIDRLPGNSTTDFGAPAMPLPPDDLPVDEVELARLQALLTASWAAFDRAVQAAQGKSLRKGPRGGGRDQAKMVGHVGEAELAYLGALGGKKPAGEVDDQTRHGILLEALVASAHGEIPALGSRGGKRWTPRFFVRRTAWHALDHAWEIEDRLE